VFVVVCELKMALFTSMLMILWYSINKLLLFYLHLRY